MNSKDPLIAATPDSGLELYKRFGNQAHGFPQEAVLNAAVNLIVNVLRQKHPQRDKAEAEYNELMGKTKGVLLNHYDALGRKRGIFAYNQNLHVVVDDLVRKN
jgi:hypothetical protein